MACWPWKLEMACLCCNYSIQGLQLSYHQFIDNPYACRRPAFDNPGSGRSPGKGNGNPFQYSWLENSMDRGAWWATAHGVTRVGHDRETNTHTYMRAWISLANYTLKSHFYLLTIRIQWCNWYFYIYSFTHHYCIQLLFFHILVADSLELSIYRI